MIKIWVHTLVVILCTWPLAVGYASDDIDLAYTAVGYAIAISQLAYTAVG